MRNPHIAWTLALTLLLIVGCAAPQQDTTDEARAGIETTNAQFMEAFSQSDVAGVAACYTEDAQLMPPNGEIVSGREAVQANFQEAMNAGLNVRLETVELESHGDTAYEVGTAIVTGEDGQTI
ncbi:MAG: nuclear transport factor 2 family protein, partial [Rhodothermales bacterium]